MRKDANVYRCARINDRTLVAEDTAMTDSQQKMQKINKKKIKNIQKAKKSKRNIFAYTYPLTTLKKPCL